MKTWNVYNIYLLIAVPNVVMPSVILMSVVAPLITLHGSKHTTDGATYYAVAVSYMCKMLMKFDHRCQCHKTFIFVVNVAAK